MEENEYTLSERVTFNHPDITYLTRKAEWEYRFIGQMIRRYGQRVVLEALRQAASDGITQNRIFVGICRRLERELPA